MNNLIEYLLDKAFRNGIGYEIAPLDKDFPSRALPEYKLIIINSNWKNKNEIPFIIGHELGHLMLGHTSISYYSTQTANTKCEYEADQYSLKLIYKYSIEQGNHFEEPYQFIEQFGIPERMLSDAKTLFKENKNE